ncbi:alginate lyase family protein [Nonlabens agnitus]|uniref:Heparinase n=1 Tax=Nonlabens agnitus TaxID=870484 RepID=A0A2S9WRS8_9FLAO|nr:alginate lyase family protein [Nonlabens agnitus]PRP66191.1 heparinase [Nonlabens agnitus]
MADAAYNDKYPSLMIAHDALEGLQNSMDKYPLWDATVKANIKEISDVIKDSIEVPIPKDMAGGYTHTRHKNNYLNAQKAAVLYQITQEEPYAIYVRDMLLEYAKIYKDLPLHPEPRSYARGKLFWQCLNDANWLVYMSQAYDAIHSYLTPQEISILEKHLFVPMADFLSLETPQFFNRIHNHSTWGNVAVGMIGLAMDNQELIDRALYGMEIDSTTIGQKDNDGGFIRTADQKAGFLANLEEPFSPDGYYTEGPYYQRYAMYPFLVFAQGLQNKRPDLKIFEYKDSVLLKAVDALLQLTDSDGDFFPINDGQKGMSYYSRELVSAVNIAYYYGSRNPSLVDLAIKQGQVQLDQTGLAVAQAAANGNVKPFEKRSLMLRDGSQGDEGGLAVIRSDRQDLELLFKFTGQGLSHGHYDKLSYSLYQDGHEVIPDYGLARFVNVEQKNGGGYLKENKTWAKQTVAHNTLVQDEKSHFDGDYETGAAHHSQLEFYDFAFAKAKIVQATEQNAYPGTSMNRTIAMLQVPGVDHDVVVDILKINSNESHQYDLPLYYQGQILQVNQKVKKGNELKPLGTQNGYQHLWKSGVATANSDNTTLNWLDAYKRFYTATMATSQGDQLIFVDLGANDPFNNLKTQPGVIQRKSTTKEAVFAMAIEAHGSYDPVSELSSGAYGSLSNLEIVSSNEDYIGLVLTTKKGIMQMLIVTLRDHEKDTDHDMTINNKNYKWTGPYWYGQIN